MFRWYTNTHKALRILPLLVYVLVFGFAQGIAQLGNCHGWWEVCWSREDSGLYLEISEIGHTLKPCGPENGYESGSGKWCGNAGWAPFYPLLIRGLHALTGWPSPVCGILLSHLFFLGFLYLVATMIRVRDFKIHNWLTLGMAALFPGGIYFFSIFPISLMVLLTAGLFRSLSENNYRVAALCSFLIPLSYSSGIIFLFCLGLYLLFLFFSNRTHKSVSTLRKELITQWHQNHVAKNVFFYVFLPGVSGLLCLYLYDYYATGHWNAMYMVQSKYGHLLYSPLKHLGNHIDLLREHWGSKQAWIDLHNIFFFFAIPVGVYLMLRHKQPLTPLLVIFTLVMWYIPYSISIKVSLYRSIGLLAPVCVYLHPLEYRIKVLIICVFAVFYLYMGELFILSILH